MKKLVFSMLMFGVVATAVAQKTPPAKTVKQTVKTPKQTIVPMKNLLDSFSYAAGYNIAMNMKDQGITNLNSTLLSKAINDAFENKQSQLNSEQVSSTLQKQLQIFAEKKAEVAKAPGRAFLLQNAQKPGITTLPSGLQYEVLTKGGDSSTTKPKLGDTVIVNYIGWLIDGTEFNNSYKMGQPAVFQLTPTGLIKGWVEALQLMSIGSKWKIYVPAELAYDMNPRDPNVTPAGSALVFEIALENIKTGAVIEAHGPNDRHNH